MALELDEKRASPAATRSQRFTVIASLYLVSDIGYAFFFGGMNTILLRGGVPLDRLALINLLGLLYVGRFVLGPLVDRVGRYRRWLLATQALLVLVWLALVPLDPLADLPVVLVVTALGLALSAVHDTAMNGLAVRMLPPADRGVGNGIQSGMACLSIVLGSGGALFLYAHMGWSVTVGVLAAIFLVPFAVLLFVVEPDSTAKPSGGPPLTEMASMLRQPRVRAWVLLVLPLFVLGLYFTAAVLAPMMLAADWPLDRIALVQGTLSGPVGLVAALATGAVLGRFGGRRSAFGAVVFCVAAIVSLVPLSLGGSSPTLDGAAVLAVTAGYAGLAACVFTVSMDLARPATAATDFTLQVSVVGVLRLAVTPVALAAAGLVGFTPVICGSAALMAAGGWVALRWLRGHQTSPESKKEFA